MESELKEVTRRYTKYIFLDVVQFGNRSAEAQTEIVSRLNEIVRKSLDAVHMKHDNDTILIPTGDGVCVGLVGSDLAYDVQMRVALDVLLSLYETNQTTQNETRRFQVRIGINQNTDILITDINGRLNVAAPESTLPPASWTRLTVCKYWSAKPPFTNYSQVKRTWTNSGHIQRAASMVSRFRYISM